MKLSLLWFAALRERRGIAHEAIELAEGTTVRDLRGAVGLPADFRVAIAVNEVIVDDDHVLQEGAEIAFLPPLGGG